jgi:YidC/Oxa1 family membrane protein insertase
MSFIFNTFLYQPLMNALVLIYQIIPGQDFGIAIILLTIIIRLILYPVSAKGVKSQRAINEIQPEIKSIQEKYKNDKEKQVKEVLEVYKKAKISPFSAFLPLLIQLPVLIALYRVLWKVQTSEMSQSLYSFVSVPSEIKSMFLGIIDLAGTGFIQEINGESVFLFGNLVIIAGAVIAQFVQMKMISAKKEKTKKQGPQETAERIQKQMMYFFPFFTFFILLKLPLAIGLYWLASTVFSIIQQHLILKKDE